MERRPKFSKSKAKSAKVELCYYVGSGVYAKVEVTKTKDRDVKYIYPSNRF